VAPGWLAGDDLRQEGHEVGAGVPRGGLAQHLARLRVQRRIASARRRSAPAARSNTVT
jgi:hypothetical protein